MIHHSYLPTFPILSAIRQVALANPDAIAITSTRLCESVPPPYTFTQLFTVIFSIAGQVLSAHRRVRNAGRMIVGGGELQSAPIALVVAGDLSVLGMLGIWLAGGVVVPLETAELDNVEAVASALTKVGAQVMLVPEQGLMSRANDLAVVMRRSGHEMRVVLEDLDLHEEPKSHEVQPPIWMVQQWEKNGPEGHPSRIAVKLLQDSRCFSHHIVMDESRGNTPSFLAGSLARLHKLASGAAI